MVLISEKAKPIKLLILDVDGILTPGGLYYGTDGLELRRFHVHDGLGIKLLQKTGVKVAVISAKKSTVVERRLKDLQIQERYLGHEEKLPAYEELKKRLKLKDEEIAYMGDDFPDLPILRRVGLAVTVPGAPVLMHEYVDFITKSHAGDGAVREVCELIIQSQDNYQSVVQSYLDI